MIPANFHRLGRSGTLCGWGTTTEDDQNTRSLGDAEYSDDLHCMAINILPKECCKLYIKSGDFRKKLVCGDAKIRQQTTTLVIT